jgi:pimeloyl-ACP methyl ester carboxylesterase/uncharacterized protein YegL
MKKRIAAALVFALTSAFVTAFVCGGALAAVPASGRTLATDDNRRDIVLVMDTSGSMSDEPLRAAKEAAIAFCKTTLERTSDTRIAVINFSSSASLVYDFGFDADGLADTVGGFASGGGTDTEEALLLASRVMDESGRNGAIHAIVLMSDGLPEDGSQYYEPDARYQSDDYGGYASYASAVYNTALTMQQYDIYTLGFFHSLDGQNLALGRQLLQDIQNKGYYDVVDPADLDFVFGDIGEAIVEANYPIIVLPGIMAGRLYMGNDLIWNGKNIYVARSAFYLGINNHLSVPACENQNDPNAHKEYGVDDSYKNLLQTLCAEFPEREIYFFSYDWRRSCRDSAERLAVFIEGLNADKADLVCHSMGGLVASQYVAADAANKDKINAIITLGTPYEGSPKTLKEPFDFPQSILHPWEFPGVGELLPTPDYVRTVDFFNRYYEFTKFQNLQEEIEFIANGRNIVNGIEYIPGNGYYMARFEPLGIDKFEEYCRKDFDAYPNSYTDIRNAQDNIKYNDLGLLASLSDAYFFVGTGQRTIVSLTFGSNSFVDSDPTQIIGTVQDVGFSNQGDDTVPYLSATMLGSLAHIENAADRVRYYDYTHEELSGSNASKTETIQDICSILRSNGFINGEINPITGRPFIVVRVACPVDVEVSAGGRTLSSALPDEDAERGAGAADTVDFGEVHRFGEDGEIKLFVLNEDIYDISINGIGEGEMDYALRYFDADAGLSKEDAFQSVPITESTVISTAADIDRTTSLNIDFDGDGETDSIWEADDAGVGAEVWTASAEDEPEASGFPQNAAAIALAAAFAAALVVILATAATSRRLLPEAAESALGETPDPYASADPADRAAPPQLLLLYGAGRGRSIPLRDGETMNIGRDRAFANIVIDENAEKVSRRHCAIVYKAEGDCYYVTDTSNNGTFLEDMTRLPKNTRVVLSRNTTLCLADRNCKILLK